MMIEPPDPPEDDSPEPDDSSNNYPEVMETEPDSSPDGELQEDGSTVMQIDDEEDEPPIDSVFYANLAIKLPEEYMNGIAQDLINKLEQDIEARKKRDKQYEEGLRRTGMGNDAPGGADFVGASRTVHPMMTEACIDFAARTTKELIPPDGPVKDKVLGATTPDKLDKAKRKVAHMNYQFTEEMPEAYSIIEQTITQVPLGGSQYIKAYYDWHLGRPTIEFCPVDYVVLPFAAGSYRSAQRRTHRQFLVEQVVQDRIDSGMYREVDLSMSSMTPDPSKSEKANEKIEGKDDSGMNLDGAREVDEFTVRLTVPDDMKSVFNKEDADSLYPYIITVDRLTSKVLGWYRNWEEGDPAATELMHMAEFKFLPWRGAYGVGLPHIIGGLSGAATGALRGLLDSAHLNNTVTAFKMESAGIPGQNVIPRPTQVSDVKAPLGTADIRQAMMQANFNPPSPVLFALLEFVVREGKGVVRTSLDETPADTNANMPVGTQLSRVEQGLVVYSSIFGRMHRGMKELMGIIHRINRMHLPEDVSVDLTGQDILVYRTDYEGPMDVIPVSDPNIFSDQQRFAQIQAVMQRSQGNPMYDPYAVEEAFLRGLKLSDPLRFLKPRPEPQRLNQVSENLAMVLGKPAIAYPDQDHLAHIQVLLDFMTSPVFGQLPIIAPSFLQAALEHLKQHIVYWYAADMYAAVTEAAGMPAGKIMSQDPDQMKQVDEILARLSPIIVQRGTQALQKIPPIVQQAMQMLQSLLPPQPMDPSQAVMQTEQLKSQQNDKKLQQEQQEAAQTDQTKRAIADQSNQTKIIDITTRAQLGQQADQTKMGIAEMDNATARASAAVDAIADKHAPLTDGGGIDRPR